MRFISTRGDSVVNSAAEAIVKGLAEDGGLFVPETFPNVKDKLSCMLDMSYPERACFVLKQFLEEYDEKDLLKACENAYAKFSEDDPVPVLKLDDKFYIMELFHGPTLAFKDVALTMLPYLLRKGSDICGIKEEILILVATSGDTGKAALEGFKDESGTKIMVFFPSDGVSDMQKLQMCTQEGGNVNVVAVKGNFDDCQTAVKKIFSDAKIRAELKEKGVILSSANSMNFGRLSPQITYYFSAYMDMVNAEEIKMGDLVDFVVPTGNFGNILAGYYAKRMGLPIDKLICASNDNNVLTEFIVSGEYNANREFFKTASPSMDILVSSNLERLIFELSNRDFALTKKRMDDLQNTGKQSISEGELDKLNQEFYADFCDEEECSETIGDIFEEYGYVLDTHTSVAVKVANSYKNFTESDKPLVVLSTASPYKFPQSVYKALNGKEIKDAFVSAEKLETATAFPIPKQLSELRNKKVRFNKVIERGETLDSVMEFIGK